MAELTTIQISKDTKEKLDKFKIMERQSYNDIIEELVEDNLELNEKTKNEIKEAVEEYKAGKFKTHAEVKKKFGF